MVDISVIVPVYNVEKYLERCLDSILNQTYDNYEIICVNDCSPDASQKILEKYAEQHKDKVQVLVNEKNMGQGKSREQGIRAAKGKYVFFIDSDDYIAEDYLETYMNEMKSSPCDVIVGGYIRDIDGTLKTHKIKNNIWSVSTYVITPPKMFSKKFLQDYEISFSKVRCAEDVFFTMDMFCNPLSYRVIDYAGYYYYMNRNSTTKSLTYDKKLECDISEMFSILLDSYDMSILSKEKYYIVEYTYIANMVNALLTYGHGCKPAIMKEKYNFFIEDLKKKFPHYKKNPYYSLKKSKGQTLKIRLAVSAFVFLNKLSLDKAIFYLASLI